MELQRFKCIVVGLDEIEMKISRKHDDRNVDIDSRSQDAKQCKFSS